jgi:hypothetical protein
LSTFLIGIKSKNAKEEEKIEKIDTEKENSKNKKEEEVRKIMCFILLKNTIHTYISYIINERKKCYCLILFNFYAKTCIFCSLII